MDQLSLTYVAAQDWAYDLAKVCWAGWHVYKGNNTWNRSITARLTSEPYMPVFGIQFEPDAVWVYWAQPSVDGGLGRQCNIKYWWEHPQLFEKLEEVMRATAALWQTK